MTDTIKGEVLVPASRFVPRCECDPSPHPSAAITDRGGEYGIALFVACNRCMAPYEQELPQGVEGIEHGKV